MKTAAIAAFGWLLPGGAYLLRRRYALFGVALVLVCAAFAAGSALQGANGWPGATELSGLDGFTATVARSAALTEILAGGPYLLAWSFGYAQSFAGGQTHEYGTVLLIVAGLINVVALCEAR